MVISISRGCACLVCLVEMFVSQLSKASCRSLYLSRLPRHTVFAPRFSKIDQGSHAFAFFGQSMFGTRCNLGIDRPVYQTRSFKLSKLFGQEALGDARQATVQFVEPQAFGRQQMVQDDALPATVDQVERHFDRAS